MSAQILALYTRSPLHVSSGPSVDLVDLPLIRERFTQFPVLPAAVLTQALREAAQQHLGPGEAALAEQLFGAAPAINRDPHSGDLITARPGCIQVLEAKLLAFPVRALRGCFAWITCPALLHRFQRDTGKLSPADIPAPAPDRALVAAKSDLVRDDRIFLEEYRLQAEREPAAAHRAVAAALRPLSDDGLWQSRLVARLAILNDDDFQHFVTTCTEIHSRVAIDPSTGGDRTSLRFTQECLPSETLLYSVLRGLPASLPAEAPDEGSSGTALASLLASLPLMQIGSDAAIGFGICALHPEPIS